MRTLKPYGHSHIGSFTELGNNYSEETGRCGVEPGPASFQVFVLPFPLPINESLAHVNVHSPHTQKGQQINDDGSG